MRQEAFSTGMFSQPCDRSSNIPSSLTRFRSQPRRLKLKLRLLEPVSGATAAAIPAIYADRIIAIIDQNSISLNYNHRSLQNTACQS